MPALDAAPAAATAPVVPGDIVVTARALPPATGAAGQTGTTVTDRAYRDTPAATVADIVRLAPGVTVIQGNGPRDTGVSIRGSNARNGFGARNIQVFEDDFPVTQPDGLARFDLADPHAYGAVDVVRGPSSARYGNYAIEGALNFRTRRGAEVRGIEAGFDGGSFGYRNVYATLGGAGDRHDYALFGSLVSGSGATGHTGYRTATVNGLATLAAGDRDRVTAKLIHNAGLFRLSTRLSFDQYRANPYQRGCEQAATAAAGCGTIAVLANGTSGARIAQTAAEGDLARDDRRTIVGVRWEHDLAPALTWRTQGVFDSRIVYQPTSATPFRGRFVSHALATELTGTGRLLGLAATSVVGLTYSYLANHSYSFNKTPAGRDGFGAPTQTVLGDLRHGGIHAREELELGRGWRLIAALGAERSTIAMRQIAYAYPPNAGATISLVPVARRFTNVAPELALTWQATAALRLHARVASAYGIPQSGQLFVTPAGVPGDNAALKTQRNTGVDLGAELALGDRLTAELTGYQEWFRDEQVTQSAGVNLLAFTTNAPRSLHRGVEALLRWEPLPRALPGAYLRAAYSYADQRYTRFTERLTTGAASAAFDRAGRRVPGVIPHFADARAGYDRRGGGIGGFVELIASSPYRIDNANLLRVPGYVLVNLDIHYTPPAGAGRWSRLSLFASVQNLAGRTYVGSATVIADSLDPAGRPNGAATLRGVTGALYAGQPRTVVAGLRARF